MSTSQKVERPAFQKEETSLQPLLAFTHWLTANRASTENPEARVGANAVIIMNSACIIDGAVEWVLRTELDVWFRREHDLTRAHPPADPIARQREINEIYENRRWEDLRRATGLTKLKATYRELTGQTLTGVLEDRTWQAVSALFELRNLIAHGRMARGDVFATGEHPRRSSVPTAMDSKSASFIWASNDPHFRTKLSPPLSSAEAYLKREGLIELGFMDGRDQTIAETYFTEAVADRFWLVAGETVRKLAVRHPILAGLADSLG